jgi:uncharacterized membrane protein YedE/YeeE
MLAATEFTPIESLIGGALIGVSAVILMLFLGRVAGISGIVGRLLPPHREPGMAGAAAFLAGLIAAPTVYTAATGLAIHQTVSDNLPLLAGAGLLVGFGAILGGGCTSGHGVCGLSRLSVRSLVATATFMATAFATVFIVRHLLTGAP